MLRSLVVHHEKKCLSPSFRQHQEGEHFSPAPGGGGKRYGEPAPGTAHAESMPLRIRQRQALHFTRVRSHTCATNHACQMFPQGQRKRYSGPALAQEPWPLPSTSSRRYAMPLGRAVCSIAGGRSASPPAVCTTNAGRA